MGTNGSIDAFCSTTNPAGIGAPELPGISAAERRRMYEAPIQEPNFPGLNACGAGCNDPEILRWRREGEINIRPMQVAPRDDIANDRINPWTRDMEHAPGDLGCGNTLVSGLTCGAIPPKSRTKAPKEYMADMPDDSSIVLNSRGLCFLKDDALPHPYTTGGSNLGQSLDKEAQRVEQWEESLDVFSGRNNAGGMFPAMPSAAKFAHAIPSAAEHRA